MMRGVSSLISRTVSRAAPSISHARPSLTPIATLPVTRIASSLPTVQKRHMADIVFPASKNPFASADESDLPLTQDEDGIWWLDMRSDALKNIVATRNEDGDMVGEWEGEEVIFPDLVPTLEWVLSSPVEQHLFEEPPIVKLYEEEDA